MIHKLYNYIFLSMQNIAIQCDIWAEFTIFQKCVDSRSIWILNNKNTLWLYSYNSV